MKILVPRKLPSANEFERMTTYREELNGYVTALHEKRAYMQRSAYEVLSLISSLERVPFVPVGLREIGTLTPQKMNELEGLVSQLSKVWQVVEEPDFPWLGCRANTYNLQVRSETLTTLEGISQTLEKLKAEIVDFSVKLGVSPPENFAMAKWLLNISKFLYESSKPEAFWLTNPHIESLYDEAKNYQDTSTWITNTRASLNQKYDPSLFDLPLDKSTKIQHQLTELSKVLPSIKLEDSSFLTEHEELLAFIRNLQIAERRWSEVSQALAQLLGFEGGGLTIEHLQALSQLALSCFAEDKPELQWFDRKYFEDVQETEAKARRLYQDYNSLKNRLAETYGEGIYNLDLDELISRYSGPYQRSIKVFNSGYRNDQKLISKVTNNGKVPKNVLDDLIDARKVKNLQTQIEEESETLKILLGTYFNKYKTDFNGAEKAIQLTAEIRQLSWVTPVPETLIKLVTNTSSPSPMIKNLGVELRGINWKMGKADQGI